MLSRSLARLLLLLTLAWPLLLLGLTDALLLAGLARHHVFIFAALDIFIIFFLEAATLTLILSWILLRTAFIFAWHMHRSLNGKWCWPPRGTVAKRNVLMRKQPSGAGSR